MPGLKSCKEHSLSLSKRRVLCLALIAACLGCSTTHYVEKADKEVYGIIEESGPMVKNMDPQFSIEREPVSLDGLPTLSEDEVDEYLGDAGRAEVGSYVLSLEKALDIAVSNSRSFWRSKLSLYRHVLGYTLVRQEYRPVFNGGRIDGRYSVRNVERAVTTDAKTGAGFAQDFENLAGTNAGLLQDYANLIEVAAPLKDSKESATILDKDRSVSASTGLSLDILLRGGARIAAGISANFLRFVTGDPRSEASSALFVDIAQPLLGSNRRSARENILQAERDLLYNLRSFTRARKQFSVSSVSAYYDLLQRKNTVLNQWDGYQANLYQYRRASAEHEQGKKPQTEVGQSQEAALSGENDWINAIQDYNDSLDEFKSFLGLPMDTKIVLDEGELDRLMEGGLMAEPPFSIKEAIQLAFASRLDYYTRLDQLDDAARKLEIAGEGLLPDISVAAGLNVPSMPGTRFQELDFKRYTWDAALSLDPKINRKGVRNAYRLAVISYDEEKLSLEEFEDELKLDLRSSFRALEQLRFQYEIQANRLELSKRRIFELELKREIGQVLARDQIEAQTDLTQAQNNLTRTVINHTLSNLNLWLDMGILYVKENGQWESIDGTVQ